MYNVTDVLGFMLLLPHTYLSLRVYLCMLLLWQNILAYFPYFERNKIRLMKSPCSLCVCVSVYLSTAKNS
jgi:hypothetical protein